MKEKNQTQFLDEKLIAKIKAIQIKAKHLVNDSFAGEYLSAFKGRGMEFEEVREYQAGDDVRAIDWNVTARNEKPFIKTFRDERELTVMFIVDVSASNDFGSKKKIKQEVASEITALLAYTALKNNDKVGLIIFSDHVEHYLPPKKGRGHVWRLIRDILTYESKLGKTSFDVPLDYLNSIQKKKCITFLISDFQTENYQEQIKKVSKIHDLIAIGLTDPLERKLPKVGFVELEDAESGEMILIDTGSSKFRNDYEKLTKKKSKEKINFFRSNGVDYIDISTEKSSIDPIIKFFKERERKLSKRS